MTTGEAALARLCDRASEVSCHYLVWENGRIDQLVPEAARAWHAGRASWRGETDINSVSIGVEIVNAGHNGDCPPYPPAQVAAVAALGRDICARHAIAPAGVLGHSDVAPSRKEDPGEHFPWQALAAAGVGYWPGPLARSGPARPVAPNAWRTQLAEIGYAVADERDAADAVWAFQRHWRPERVDGVVDPATAALIAAIAAATG